MRKHFLDNLRWSVVLMVLVYHVFYNFNAEGVFGGLGSFADVQYQDSIMYVLYPWFMVVLFLVSGVCSRYALASKGPGAFVRSRTVKLLVPSTVGLFVFQWILGYFNTRIAGAWDSIPSFARYPAMVLSGVGPLWFIQLLWLYSLLAAVIYRIFPGRISQEKNSQAAGSVTSAATSTSGRAQASGLSRKLASGLALLVGGFLLLWGAAQGQIDSPSTAQGLLNLYRSCLVISSSLTKECRTCLPDSACLFSLPPLPELSCIPCTISVLTILRPRVFRAYGPTFMPGSPRLPCSGATKDGRTGLLRWLTT